MEGVRGSRCQMPGASSKASDRPRPVKLTAPMLCLPALPVSASRTGGVASCQVSTSMLPSPFIRPSRQCSEGSESIFAEG
jgi:hypothetical protein